MADSGSEQRLGRRSRRNGEGINRELQLEGARRKRTEDGAKGGQDYFTV